jgi:hypothetical protein
MPSEQIASGTSPQSRAFSERPLDEEEEMQIKLSHHNAHPDHAPSDLLAMAALIVALLAVALLIGASLSAMKISSGTLPAPMPGTASIFGDTIAAFAWPA